MNPGKLRTLLELQTPTQTLDSDGNLSESWVTVAGVWAEIREVTQGEEWRNVQAQVKATHRITCRFHPSITPRARFRGGSSTYRIARARTINSHASEMEIFALAD